MHVLFNIALSGDTLPGADPRRVIGELAALFKLDELQAATLLLGKETIIKRQLPRDKLHRYLQAINATGAAVRVYPTQGAEGMDGLQAVRILETVAGVLAQLDREKQGAEDAVVELATGSTSILSDAPLTSFELPHSLAGSPVASAARDYDQATTPLPRLGETVRWARKVPPLFALDLHGRIGRTRYLAYSLVIALPFVLTAVCNRQIAGMVQHNSLLAWLVSSVLVAGSAIWLRLAALRSHDVGLSSAWLLPLPALALASMAMPRLWGPSAVLLLACQLGLCLWPGNRSANRYGGARRREGMQIKLAALLSILLSSYGAFASQLDTAAMQSTAAHPHIEVAPSAALERSFADAVDHAARERGVTLSASQRTQAIAHMRERWQSNNGSQLSDTEDAQN
jgi:uncharacterized membrane protein YhaH (DUF805 family)